MSFDLPADLERDVARYAEEAHVTPEEAVARLVQDGLAQAEPERTRKGPRPPVRDEGSEGSIGLFADLPDFVETMEKVISGREAKYTRHP